LPACDPVEATIPEGAGVSARSGVLVHREALEEGEVIEQRGLPATSPVRTAVDLGRHLPLVEGVVAVDMALKNNLVQLPQLRWYVVAEAGQKGIVRLRKVTELAEPASESPMETRLRLLLVLAGLPRPEAQVSLYDDAGGFLGRPDLLYREARLALEYDGGTHRSSLADDNRRQNRLLAAGFRLLRFTAGDVLGTPDAVVALVRSALYSS
jgi:hypothetical protein